MRVISDLCLFADDDMEYVDGYEEILRKVFEQIPKADVIIFNLLEFNLRLYIILKIQRVTYFNYLRYGMVHIAFKLKPVRENGIFFNMCLGGGTEHSHGEGNLFVTEYLKKVKSKCIFRIYCKTHRGKRVNIQARFR